jgi:hypothetical protein
MISLIRQDNFSKTLWLAGTSSDTKPTDAFNYKGAILPVTNGSAFLEVDTSTYYVFDAENGEWFEQSSGGGGGIEPEGSIEITKNGTYNVKRKAQAVVNVPNDVASFIEATPAVIVNDDVTAVKNYAFDWDQGLQSVNFKKAAYMGSHSFNNCTSLVNVSIPECIAIYNNAFEYCEKLETVVAPKCTNISDSAFSGCYKLVSCPFEEVVYLGRNAFYDCRLIENVKFKKLSQSVGDGAFSNCKALISADLGEARSLGARVFRSNPLFNTLILRKTDAICTLSHVNTFEGTAIQAGNGFIYVPRTLIDTYKSATNWSIYAAYFRALEDYTVDGTTTGDLDPSKI